MFRIFYFPTGAMSQKLAVWIHESRGGSNASRAEARGIRADVGAYLIYDAS